MLAFSLLTNKNTTEFMSVASEIFLWPLVPRYELSSPSRMLGSWVLIPLETRMCVHLFCIYVIPSVVGGFATGRFRVQGVQPTLYTITKLKKWP
jgi:hypothetical protein